MKCNKFHSIFGTTGLLISNFLKSLNNDLRLAELETAGIACLVEHSTGTFLCGCKAKRVDIARASTTLVCRTTFSMTPGIKSWVADDIELGAQQEDHSAVMCSVALTKDVSDQPQGCSMPKRIDRNELARQLNTEWAVNQLASSLVPMPWTLNPHDSADLLASQARHALYKALATQEPCV